MTSPDTAEPLVEWVPPRGESGPAAPTRKLAMNLRGAHAADASAAEVRGRDAARLTSGRATGIANRGRRRDRLAR
jgi:hypothetical protein